MMDTEEAKVKEGVIKALKRLKSEGKNLLGGYFSSCNGNVILTVSNHSSDIYSVSYCCYSVMFNYLINKTEIEIDTTTDTEGEQG